MEFRFRISRHPIFSDITKIYLFGEREGKNYCYKVKDGFLEESLYDTAAEPEPFLEINELFRGDLFNAFANGLKDAGYVAEVDNAQRITAQALAEEREKEISWLRTEVSKLLGKINASN